MVGARQRKAVAGFTLVEVMVGVVLFTIGVVGFTGMSLLLSKGQSAARTRDESATLAQSLVEDMAGVSWTDVGSDTGLPAYNGLTGAAIRVEGPLNRNGDEVGTGEGPYQYWRYIVVCTSADSAVAPAASSDQDHCKLLDDSNRPEELACNSLTLSDREKMVRVIVSFTDRDGECRGVHIDSLAFDWDGSG